MSMAVEQIVKPYHQTERFSLYEGDCRSVLPILVDCYFDSIVCDPPYELGFMGKGWDRSGIAYDVEVWRECLRVLKPGGHLLAFGGSRTYHRLACAIEDAGFEIRDQIQWLYGSGFPKSLDVSKAIDAAAGAEREVVGFKIEPNGRCMALESELPRICNPGDKEDRKFGSDNRTLIERKVVTAPATDEAKQWSGWGTALKPAHEPIVLARKPLIGTVAENVLQHGTGGLNIDRCRIQFQGNGDGEWNSTPGRGTKGQPDKGSTGIYGYFGGEAEPKDNVRYDSTGRWPANVIHDGSDEVLARFPETASAAMRYEVEAYEGNGSTGFLRGRSGPSNQRQDSGSAARFFYTAKATQEDRNEGLDGVAERQQDESRKEGNPGGDNPRNRGLRPRANHHPTVKPTDLMRYLCRLITPPGGIVLDPFCGSGSTGKAAMLEGFKFVGIELNADYCQLAQLRIEAVTRQGLLFA